MSMLTRMVEWVMHWLYESGRARAYRRGPGSPMAPTDSDPTGQ